MPNTITITELLNFILGSTTVLGFYTAWKTRKSTIKQTEATALESIDSIYDKMSIRVSKELQNYQDKIDKLEKRLDDYITQCSTCENNKLRP